ncbi:phage holin family protein [Pseudoruegeria sp. HB172150]|uniref:phage holin family protein n=1 Tax=Pseudoruegeria sp. HB172150 TaxID=2721164 RepID=UPI0015574F61|nr:phage holin family protein [Pseudoruegeria sp. HB172150]
MIKFLISTAAYLLANGAGLLVATLILPGFHIDFLAFVVAVLIFSAFQTFAGPLVTKLSLKQMPQLVGGIALVTIFFGLLVTNMLMPKMEIGGIANLLAATLLVWLGAIIATILIPIYVFKELRENKKEREEEIEQDAQRAVAAAEQAAAAAESAARSAAAANPPPPGPDAAPLAQPSPAPATPSAAEKPKPQ